MKVTNNPLLADMQSMIAEMRAQQGVTQIPTQPSQAVEPTGNTSRADFGAMLKSAIDNVNDLQQHAGELRGRIEMGDPNVSIAEGMIAAQKSSIAFEAAVQVRNKVVEAYEKIMQMPV
ncbi:flagellar hook-basal body complex protein FliE [Aliidiomarina taiwanensis]|uniref:Flagellar hook-basal body complex protein FliE n=1 Tax=Aliidiomarina taiwanensis TaxID=946228 RepID=A0A432WZ51_9GAMM|nr:flagellar hook-basal body complex protein FliE [Aliidiomarina taiwanensis]RUO39046.1 flagellar hook-basal body complex protein FliE [Aliidiomarina taiwanensis]